MPNGRDIALGIAQGAERFSRILLETSLAKEKLKQDRELFGLKKKEAELNLRNKEGLVDSGLLDLQRDNLKRREKLMGAFFDVAEADLKTKEISARGGQRDLQSFQSGASLNFLGEELDIGKLASGADFPFSSPAKVGRKEQIEEGIRRAQAGEISFDAVKHQFPLDRDMIEEARSGIARDVEGKKPLTTRIAPVDKPFFGKIKNQKTVDFAESIQTRQDLIDMITNADALEDRGIDVAQLEELYEKELLELTSEGFLTEE